MPSFTSSSEIPVTGRPLPECALGIAAIVALVVTLVATAAWELQWRNFGATPSYKNSDGLWAIERRRIDNGEGDKTVIIGSSRMFFDTQLSAWERVTGERPIQLSLEGTSPMKALQQLADDPDLTGTLVVGVTPILFFNGFAYRGDVFDHYLDEAPSQRIGQQVSMIFEPLLGFYQPDFALFTVLERQPWPTRDGVPVRKDVRKLANFDSDRNGRLWKKVETDPEYLALVKEIWSQNFRPLDKLPPPVLQQQTKNRAEQLELAVAAVEKLHARGVRVVFVRPPSEGPFAETEAVFQPRAEAWDQLIERTGAHGIHFADHPGLQGGWLPEWSHLAGDDADRYTTELAQLYHDLPPPP
ncbi:MAG: hypothetical protein HKN49_03150 [Gammaproteobacteria bacterium]|nr:hypothetical protein [Gammaproteobacteria bacterium]